MWAVGIGIVTLTFYVLTLRPDFGGPEASPKFQFVGYVLGTAHSPGYPLYTLLTYFSSHLPIGNIAYRANLFSAVAGALACAISFVLARQLNVSRGPAVAAALALATTGAFWHNA